MAFRGWKHPLCSVGFGHVLASGHVNLLCDSDSSLTTKPGACDHTLFLIRQSGCSSHRHQSRFGKEKGSIALWLLTTSSNWHPGERETEEGEGRGENRRGEDTPITQVLTHRADQSTGWRCLPVQPPELRGRAPGASSPTPIPSTSRC